MRKIDGPSPNLGQSRWPYRGFGSKDWVPRTSAGRVGGIVFGTVFVTSGLMMLVSTYVLKQELQKSISSPPVAFVVSLVAVLMTLAVGSFTIWLGGRLLVVSFRHAANQKRKASDKEFHV
jgi:hypothetical protein